MWTEKVNVNGTSLKNNSNSREGTMKLLLKNFMIFSQIFQIPGLRKMNIPNSDSSFDQNECNM